MTNPLDTLRDLDWSDRKVQIAAMGVGGIFAYAVVKARAERNTGATESTLESPPIPDTFGTVRQPGTNVPGVIGNVGSYPVPGPAGPKGETGVKGETGATGTAGPKGSTGPAAPTAPKPTPKPTPVPTAKKCPTGQTGVLRDGKIVCAGIPSKATITCPPGYVVVQSPGKPQRCSIKDDKKIKPGEKATYYPKKTGGQAGENVSAMDAYHGRVGGVFPSSYPITTQRSYTVAEGDTPNSIARKIYGGPEWLNKLVAANGPLGDMKVGDVLDV